MNPSVFFRKWIGYRQPEVIESFKTNRKLEPFDLAVVTCYFNSNHYQSRRLNFKKFFEHYQKEFSRVPLLVIELAFSDDPFELNDIPGVWQLRTKDVLWQKERLLNLGIKKLLAEGYKNIAWVDADIIFTDRQWPEKAVDVLDSNHLCQLFSQSIREEEMNLKYSARNSVARAYEEDSTLHLMGLSCGYAWAARSELLSKISLYDRSILGGGDAAIWLGSQCYEGKRNWNKQVSKITFFQSLGKKLKENYLKWAMDFGHEVQGRVGYVDQKVIALYHGKLANRLYSTRYMGTAEFDPDLDLILESNGCWSWSTSASALIREKVRLYFHLRKEDEPLDGAFSEVAQLENRYPVVGDFSAIAPNPIKLCIQIPCYNEEQTLLETIRAIPKEIPGVATIEIVVIDDGSSDETGEVARFAGVKHVVKSKAHRGLAHAFKMGIQKCLSLEADIIVNLDADNQYPASFVVALIRPILQGRADIVLGARRFSDSPDFSRVKVFFQRTGSHILSKICRVPIPDAATGFRAFSRKAASKINIFTKYTYTLETLIQAAQNGEKIISIPIRTNPVTRPSRLFVHPAVYVLRSSGAIIRLVLLYSPLRTLSALAIFLFICSVFCFRYSIILGIALALAFLMTFFVGLILDQIAVNRRLLEAIQQKSRDADD